ncbi:MAG: DUF4271 domain-containing protein [Cyclobacteriaceae bacterium]|jgi:hypothetical protein|nr:DUF4271 domain-containing protein [Cyclobacteriaceae bacterium]
MVRLFWMASWLFLSWLGVRAEVTRADLRTRWHVQAGSGYQAYDARQSVTTISFELDGRSASGLHLAITDGRPHHLFINGQLAASWPAGTRYLSVDSLATHFGYVMWVSVHQPGGIHLLATTLVDRQADDAQALLPRPGRFFSDFAILCSLLLMAAFVALFRASPQLAWDYFNFTKLFSLQDRESNLLAGRLTTSINILYFLFSSGLAALIILVLVRLVPSVVAHHHWLLFRHTGHGFLIWLALTASIFGLLLVRLVLVNMTAALFQVPEAHVQFFQAVRAILFNALIWMLLCVSYAVFGLGASLLAHAPTLITTTFALTIVFVFIKLAGRGGFPVSYLFFYLCITEMLPLMILSSVFFG